MIPDWDPATGNLPPGVHRATWKEVEERFGFSPERQELLRGLRAALGILQQYGCRRVWIDGSFISDKHAPADFDGCWEYRGAQIADLRTRHPMFFDVTKGRLEQKLRFGGELFIAQYPANLSGTRFLELFQTDKSTGEPKGIILVDLTSENSLRSPDTRS